MKANTQTQFSKRLNTPIKLTSDHIERMKSYQKNLIEELTTVIMTEKNQPKRHKLQVKLHDEIQQVNKWLKSNANAIIEMEMFNELLTKSKAA